MTTPDSHTQEVKLLRIIDGDTVEIQRPGAFLRTPPKERIRLWGIDAPESSQQGGNQSTKYLRRLIGNRHSIWLTRMDTDQYGRVVGVIQRNKSSDHSYNYQMVIGGHAHCYMLSGADQTLYRSAERQAHQKRLGLWNKRNPEKPWDYRARQKAKQSSSTNLKLVFVFLAILAFAFLSLRACQNLTL